MSARTLQLFSLRTKLLLFAAVLVVVPGGIYGWVTVSQSRAALGRVVGRQLVAEARNVADRLATTLRSEQSRFESLALQDVMREIRIGDLDKRIASFLSSAKRGCAACLDLAVLDGNDRVVASSNPAWIGSVAEVSIFGTGGERRVDGPVAPATGEPAVLRFTLPVADPDTPSSSLGRFVALLDWERATEVVSRARENLLSVGLDADVLIVDEAGRVIGAAVRADGPWQTGDVIGRRPVEGAAVSPAGRIDPGVGMLLGEARLPEDLPPWRIVAAQPLEDAFAPVDRTVALLGTILGATLLAGLTIAVLAARRVTRPLGELTATAERIARGEQPPMIVPQRSRDEIGTLAAAFHDMWVDLRRAQRELADAAKFAFVGELAAGVAHEVRTPLGVLRSSAQLLERSLETKDEEARELLANLREEVDRIERVVSGLLELGRPRELRPEPSRLGEIVFRAVDFIEAQAREREVSIRRRPLEYDPEAMCDPELVYQVVLNLLVNAVQILPKGGSVEVALLPPRDGYAGFEIHDDGPGMTAEVRRRIFEPFFTRREGGAGLGLTFVQRVVQEHRGRISMKSAPGRGAVFRIELPRPEASR